MGTATCGDLFLHEDGTLHGSAPVSGVNPVLQTTGNLYVYGAAAIIGVEGNRRLDLRVNDGVYQGVLTRIVAEPTNPDANTGV